MRKGAVEVEHHIFIHSLLFTAMLQYHTLQEIDRRIWIAMARELEALLLFL